MGNPERTARYWIRFAIDTTESVIEQIERAINCDDFNQRNKLPLDMVKEQLYNLKDVLRHFEY